MKTPQNKNIFCFSSVLLFLILSISAPAQLNYLIGIDTSSTAANRDFVNSLVEKNGDIWVGGKLSRTLSSSGQVYDYGALIQMNSVGQFLITKKSTFRNINSIAVTADGNFLVGGEGSGFVCTSGMCKVDMLVAKITPLGNRLWARSYGNPNYNGSDGLKCVIETADSNVVAVGNIYQTTNTSHAFVAKIKGSNGDTLWSRAISMYSNQIAYYVSEGPSGEIYVAMGGVGGMRVAKFSSAGTLIWMRSFSQYGNAIRLKAQPDGTIIVAGQYLASTNNYNVCLFKINSLGSLLWFKDYSTAIATNTDYVNDMVVSTQGDFYLAGEYYSSSGSGGTTALVIKTDTVGNLLWAREYPGVQAEAKALLMMNGNLIVGVDHNVNLGNNKPDILLTTFDAAGNNGCFVNINMFVGSPTITPIGSSASYYTDYETDLTTPSFSNQGYWKRAACITTGIEAVNDEKKQNPFAVFYHQGVIQINPLSDVTSFNYTVIDMAGRVIANETSAGHTTVDVSRFATQLYLVRVWYMDEAYTFKTGL